MRMELSSITSSLPKPSFFTHTLPSTRPAHSINCVSFRTNGKNLRIASPLIGNNRRGRSRRSFVCYSLFGLGVPELVVIAGVAALVFGPKKLPEIGKSIGKTVKSFQEAAKEFESELKKEPENAENPVKTEMKKQDAEVSSTKESS